MNILYRLFLAASFCITLTAATENQCITEKSGYFDSKTYKIPKNIKDITSEVKSYADINFSQNRIKELYQEDIFEKKKIYIKNQLTNLNEQFFLKETTYDKFTKYVYHLTNSFINYANQVELLPEYATQIELTKQVIDNLNENEVIIGYHYSCDTYKEKTIRTIMYTILKTCGKQAFLISLKK